MENLKKNLRAFIDGVKQYYLHDSNPLIIEKTFNRGMGRLSLCRFYPEKEVVLINHTICNNSDVKKITEFCRDNNINDWQWIVVGYGYPDYYTKSFSLNLVK